MPDIKRQIKLVTQSHILADRPAPQEGFPLRKWSVTAYLVNAEGEQVPATIFDKATYHLHESFGAKAKQVKKEAPFKCEEEGWGEFDMQIVFTGKFRGGDHPVTHDLHFQQEEYESLHTITFRNPKPDLINLLSESGPTENGTAPGKKGAGGGDGGNKKKGRTQKHVDMEKLADGLQKLDEDSLLKVVEMIHDQKSTETYTKNDVENGEFHVDLYTLPDALVKNLWEFTAQKVEL